MAEAFLGALSNFQNASFVLAVVGGVIIGLIVGVIPGINSIMALSLFLPFVFGLEREIALPLMVALTAVTYQGGSITAILLSVPGVEPSAATILDGFPMAQKGQAGRALGAALTASVMGGVLAGLLGLAMVPLILPVIYGVTTADMVFIILLGLAFIGVLGRGSMTKGLVSGALGILLSLVGFQFTTGVSRFTFGIPLLYEGIPIVPLILGMFALPEMLALAAKGGTIAQTKMITTGMRGVWEGAKDVIRHWWLWLRCSVIGYVIGVIPGVGTITATFVCYAHAKQTSKHPEEFGGGTVEGVIAPESANNAECGGAVLTTLALGIPGNAPMVLLLSAIIMLGLIPGPTMLTDNLKLSISLLWVVVVANVLATAICFFLASYMARLAYVPSYILSPLVIGIALVATFAAREQFMDVILALIFTALGLAMRRWDYNRPALVLGFVMGVLFESNLFIALNISGPLFFLRPLSLTLFVLFIILLSYGPVKSILQHRRGGGRT